MPLGGKRGLLPRLLVTHMAWEARGALVSDSHAMRRLNGLKKQFQYFHFISVMPPRVKQTARLHGRGKGVRKGPVSSSPAGDEQAAPPSTSTSSSSGPSSSSSSSSDEETQPEPEPLQFLEVTMDGRDELIPDVDPSRCRYTEEAFPVHRIVSVVVRQDGTKQLRVRWGDGWVDERMFSEGSQDWLKAQVEGLGPERVLQGRRTSRGRRSPEVMRRRREFQEQLRNARAAPWGGA